MLKQMCLATVAVAALIGPANAEVIYGLVGNSGSQQLIAFDSASPGTTTYSSSISGLTISGNPNNSFNGTYALNGIDFRPANGQLYGYGTNGLGAAELFSISLGATATATAIGSPGPVIGGGTTNRGVDFNPVADALRIVQNSSNGQVNPTTGVATTNTNLAYVAGDPHAGAQPGVIAAAYTNNVAGATSTMLYDLDATFNSLALQNPPNAGTLSTVAAVTLGGSALDVPLNAGFDISGATGIAYFSDSTALYSLNLATGAATSLGLVNSASLSSPLRGISVQPQNVGPVTPAPEPATLGLLGAGLLGLAGMRRRRT